MNEITKLLNFSSKKELPVILQSEQAECGLVCLAMISNFYGYRIGMPLLRRRYSVSLKGTNLLSLVKIANELRLSTRPVKIELESLALLKGPSILHWNLNHFVVLKKTTSKSIIIHDPAKGIKTLSWNEASKHFTGVALELAPMSDFEKKEEPEESLKLRDFWKNILGLPQTLSQILLLSLFLQLLTLASPFYMQLIIDEVLVRRDTELLLLLGFCFSSLVLINTGTESIRSQIIIHLSAQINLQMGANLFHHLLRLPISFFEKRHMGDIISRFDSLDNVRELLSRSFVQTVIDGIMTLITITLMFVYSIKLTFIVLILVVVYFSIRMMYINPLKEKTEEKIIELGKEKSSFIESVRGIQTIKMHGYESERHSIWQNQFADYINADIQVAKIGINQSAANTFIFGIENIIIGFFAALMIINGEFSIGMLFAFMTYKMRFIERIDGLISNFVELKMLKLHLARIADIAYTSQEENLYPNDCIYDGHLMTGSLSLKEISFRYAETEPLIFEGLSVDIHAGESIALIGPSGSGKTTLAKIMCGLFKPTNGEIQVDGIKIQQLSLGVYRDQIAAVMQDDQLLSGSIRENICFFHHDADLKKIQQVAKLAAIHNDIMAMPMQYNSLIGDMGTTLSGGQKQRILLARALYRKPQILFLDEATSHLDIKTESLINDAVKRMNITRIIVAHRAETIQSADRIMILTNSKLTEISKEEWSNKIFQE